MKEEPPGAAGRGRFHEIGRIIVYRIELAVGTLDGSSFRREYGQTAVVVRAVQPFHRVHDSRAVRQPGRCAVVPEVKGQAAGQKSREGRCRRIWIGLKRGAVLACHQDEEAADYRRGDKDPQATAGATFHHLPGTPISRSATQRDSAKVYVMGEVSTGRSLGLTVTPRNWNTTPAGGLHWRLGLTLILAIYGWICLRSPGSYRWLDSLDLAIHETGHLVFAPGGETIRLLGGTLMQLLVPAAFVVALWRRGDRHGATVPLWWLGQNCWNISVYIRDARLQELPLVGGGEHDWAVLLAEWGWLERDQTLGGTVYLVGVLLYLVAIGGGWMLLVGSRSGHPAGESG